MTQDRKIFHKDQKTQITKFVNNYYTAIENYMNQVIIKRVKRQATTSQIFAIHVADKEFVSTTDDSQISIKKKAPNREMDKKLE